MEMCLPEASSRLTGPLYSLLKAHTAPARSTHQWRRTITTVSLDGWFTENFKFKATSTTETLSFLALGTPKEEPPIVLLAGVDVTKQGQAVPEPGTSSVLGICFTAIAGLAYWRPKWVRVPD